MSDMSLSNASIKKNKHKYNRMKKIDKRKAYKDSNKSSRKIRSNIKNNKFRIKLNCNWVVVVVKILMLVSWVVVIVIIERMIIVIESLF